MSFSITLMNSTAEPKKVDKSSYLSTVDTLTGTLRDGCDVVTPVIDIAISKVPTFNYVFIPVFSRYYFVTSLRVVNNGYWQISLKCDVLYTYHSQISELSALVSRSQSDYNDLLPDNMIPTKCGYTIQAIESTGTANFNASAQGNMLLSVVGTKGVS